MRKWGHPHPYLNILVGEWEMGMEEGLPIPIPISIWGWKSSQSSPISSFLPNIFSPNEDGDMGKWGSERKCTTLDLSDPNNVWCEVQLSIGVWWCYVTMSKRIGQFKNIIKKPIN